MYNNKIQTADMILAQLGISIEEYISSKQASMASPPKEVPTQIYLSRKEAAALFRCSTDTIDNLIASGKIKSVKLAKARCGRVLIDRKSVFNYISNLNGICNNRGGK